jgi:hypothetical protein
MYYESTITTKRCKAVGCQLLPKSLFKCSFGLLDITFDYLSYFFINIKIN